MVRALLLGMAFALLAVAVLGAFTDAEWRLAWGLFLGGLTAWSLAALAGVRTRRSAREAEQAFGRRIRRRAA